MNLLDPLEFFPAFFKIIDKNQKVVKFFPNLIQSVYYRNRSNRDLILKARQPGISCFLEGLGLFEILVNCNTNFVVISHEEKATERLLARMHFYLDHLPVDVPLDYASKQELKFPREKSRAFIYTAGQKATSRGETINFLHGSEIAQWANASDTLTGAAESVPTHGRIVLESTAHGAGNFFHELWLRSEKNESEWQTHFFGWNLVEEYSFTSEQYDHIARRPFYDQLTNEEEELRGQFDLSMDQIRWRRWKINTMLDPTLFPQEYPITAEEAFVARKGCVFDIATVHSMLKKARPPEYTGFLVDGGIQRDDNGWVKIWRMPMKGHSYIIGADVGGGKESGDPSAAAVIDVTAREQVAEFHTHIHPDLYGKELAKLGYFYRNALMVVERNSMGLGTIRELYNIGYQNLFTEKKFKKGYEKDTENIGIYTSPANKEAIINSLKKEIRGEREGDNLVKKPFEIHSKFILSEMLNFVYKPSKHNENHVRMEAIGSEKDDRVMSLSLGTFAMPDAMYIPPDKPQVEFGTLKWFMNRSFQHEVSSRDVYGI